MTYCTTTLKAYGLISAVGKAFGVIDITFYINLVLVLCTLVTAAAFVVLCKKTSCALVAGFASVLLFAAGTILFVIQLFLYVYNKSGAEYAVYLCMALLYSGFLVGVVYGIMLSRNSHKVLCVATGIFCLIPPLGAACASLLSYKIRRDSRGQALVYNGYAYTYATLGEFCSHNKTDYADAAGGRVFKTLDKRQTKVYLKALKIKATAPAGIYDYAAAVMHYTPYNYKKAIKLMGKAADANFAAALFNLGYCYETGAYVKTDYKKAKLYYVKAADAGDADASLRLGILAVKDGNAHEGLQILRDRLESTGDLYAQYNIGICYERGQGVDVDEEKALDIFVECAHRGMLAAQKHIFMRAATDINLSHNDDYFRKATNRKYDGEFAVMIEGLIEIKKRQARDAAELFLSAVKMHGEWEGLARCLVGALYIDCGKLPNDKNNGAEYIKSAIPLLPFARHIYEVVSKADLKKKIR